nr:acyl-CoA dehydrogenase [Streptomyces sp. HNM0575]
MLTATAEQVFADSADSARTWEAEPCTPARWAPLEETGLALVSVPESLGGSGGTLTDAAAVLHAAGRHAAPLPVAETILAAWLLTRAGVPAPAGPATVAPGADGGIPVPGTGAGIPVLRRGRLDGVLADVPWARSCGTVVCLAAGPDGQVHIVQLDPADCHIEEGLDLAGQPRDRLVATGAEPVVALPAPGGLDAGALRSRGALLRAAQLAGAIEAVADLTLEYTQQRVQFGRPVAAFQAVQLHLVRLAQMSAMTNLTVLRAARAAEDAPLPSGSGFEVDAAKEVANEAAAVAASAAHQAHGAMGLTLEYRLHRLTRRLHAWRGEFGSSRVLRSRLGAAVLDHGIEAAFTGGTTPTGDLE